MISAVVEAAGKRIKVMAGTGSNSTEEALRLTRWAAKAGADAALVVAPYYNKPTQEGFFQHFRALAEAVDIPICVYNIPGRTGKNIEPETIIRMAELPNITMVKEATGSLDQASQIINATDLTVLSGDDSLTLAAVVDRRPRRGLGRGQHRSQGRDCAVRRLRRRATWPGAQPLAPQALPAVPRHAGTCRPIPIPIKAAMQMLGRDTGDLRMPMTPLSPAEEAKLRTTLVQYGLLKK